jgi:hypothetical protein
MKRGITVRVHKTIAGHVTARRRAVAHLRSPGGTIRRLVTASSYGSLKTTKLIPTTGVPNERS